MKKIIVLASAAVLLLAGCTKEQTGVTGSIDTANEQQSSPVESFTNHTCSSGDLTHYEAKEATAKDFGNIEYWQCSKCGRKFKDAEGTQHLDRPYLLLPERYKILKRTFGNDALTKAGDGYVQILMKYSTLLKDLMNNLSGYVEYTETNDGFGGRKEQLDKITTLVGDIDITTEVINQKMDEIMELVNSIYYDVPELVNYSNTINDRFRSISKLNTETGIVLVAMDSLMKKYPSPMSPQDSVELEGLWKAEILEWGQYNAGVYRELAEDLLAKYTAPMSTQPELDYPGVLKSFVDYYTLVEEDGYAFRELNLAIDFVAATGAYMLDYLYYYYEDIEDPLYKQNKLTYVDDAYKAYLDALYAEIKDIRVGGNYCLHTTVDGKEVSKYFYKTPKMLDFTTSLTKFSNECKEWKDDNDPDYNPYVQMLTDLISDSGITASNTITGYDIALLHAYYGNNMALRDILEKEIGIQGIPQSSSEEMRFYYYIESSTLILSQQQEDEWEQDVSYGGGRVQLNKDENGKNFYIKFDGWYTFNDGCRYTIYKFEKGPDYNFDGIYEYDELRLSPSFVTKADLIDNQDIWTVSCFTEPLNY